MHSKRTRISWLATAAECLVPVKDFDCCQWRSDSTPTEPTRRILRSSGRSYVSLGGAELGHGEGMGWDEMGPSLAGASIRSSSCSEHTTLRAGRPY